MKLIQEGLSDMQIANEIATSRAGELRGDASKGKYVVVVYDLKVSGEASSTPAHRVLCRASQRRPLLVFQRWEARGGQRTLQQLRQCQRPFEA